MKNSVWKDSWNGLLTFAVDASTEDLAHARFFRTVCPLWAAVREKFGVSIIAPSVPELYTPQLLYRQYKLGIKRVPPGDPEAVRIPPAREETGDLPSYVCRLPIAWILPEAVETWDEASRWLWEMFDPPIAPGFRLIEVAELMQVHYS